jgi:GT2 family glycosyltransferase
VQSLFEPKPGLSRAHNRALLAARGELLAFTDDDCRLHPDYGNDLLRYYAADTEPVLRGGRIERGDPSDSPITTKTAPDPMQWSRRDNSARRSPIIGEIHGCNMTMPRAIVERLGLFDERFGPGAVIPAGGGDSDYLFRAYLAGFTLAYVPDMAVAHYHGRKTAAEVNRLMQGYLTANGALYAKHGWEDFNLCRPFFWDVKNAIREIITGKSAFRSGTRVRCAIEGALRYWIVARRAGRHPAPCPAASPPHTTAYDRTGAARQHRGDLQE